MQQHSTHAPREPVNPSAQDLLASQQILLAFSIAPFLNSQKISHGRQAQDRTGPLTNANEALALF